MMKVEAQCRAARWEDLDSMVKIAVSAFEDDEAEEYFNPRRHEFPEDYAMSWRRMLQTFFLQPNVLILVAETMVTQPLQGQQCIAIGFVVWMFDPFGVNPSGTKPKDLDLEKNSFSESFWRKVLPLRTRVELYFHPDRTVDPEAAKSFPPAQQKEIQECWSGEYRVHWHVGKIAVDPKWQRQGVGTILMVWGFKQSEKDGVVMGLESVKNGYEFYKKLGFREIGEIACRRPDAVWPVMIK